jgi:acyl carrier protein
VPASQRLGVVEALVRGEVARVLGIGAAGTIDPHAGLRDMGLDPLMAIELRNALQAGFERRLPATLAFDFPTVATLAGHLASHILGLDPSAAAGDADDRTDAKAAELEAIQQLSEVEAEALLAQELDAGQSHGGGRERP